MGARVISVGSWTATQSKDLARGTEGLGGQDSSQWLPKEAKESAGYLPAVQSTVVEMACALVKAHWHWQTPRAAQSAVSTWCAL